MERLRYLTEQTSTANDVGLLVLRVVVAVIFVRHGWGDVFDSGVSNNVEAQRSIGIPLPEIAAPYSAYMQLLGGALLIPGLFSRVISAGLVVVMSGALIWVHGTEQIPIGPDGSGSGFAMIMGAAALALLFTGPGRLSLDHLIAARADTDLRMGPTTAVGQSA
jgi:putative oxidoreductase